LEKRKGMGSRGPGTPLEIGLGNTIRAQRGVEHSPST